jgi:hypothetical protein
VKQSYYPKTPCLTDEQVERPRSGDFLALLLRLLCACDQVPDTTHDTSVSGRLSKNTCYFKMFELFHYAGLQLQRRCTCACLWGIVTTTLLHRHVLPAATGKRQPRCLVQISFSDSSNRKRYHCSALSMKVPSSSFRSILPQVYCRGAQKRVLV